MPVTLTYLFKETRHVPGVFVRDLLRLVDAVRGFAASVDAAVGTFQDGGCFAALARLRRRLTPSRLPRPYHLVVSLERADQALSSDTGAYSHQSV